MITVTVSVLSRLAEISVQSSLLIAVVFLLRAASGERPDKRLRYYLWLPVIMRLLLPFSVGSRFSVMNLFSTAAHTGPAETTMLSGASALTEGFSRLAAQTDQQTIYASFPWETAVLCVWLAGTVFVGWFALRSNALFYGRLKKCRKEVDIGIMSWLCAQMGIKRVPTVYISDKAASPCAAGIFCPTIYLPSWAVSDTDQLRYILLHELTHIKRRDNLLSLLLSICCAVYWFDPLVWLMTFSARRDRELACDAWVTDGMKPSEKTAYGMALISAVRMQSGRYICPRTASFVSRKDEMLERIKAIKQDRKTSKVLTLCICTVMVLTYIVFGTSATAAAPKSASEYNNENGENTTGLFSSANEEITSLAFFNTVPINDSDTVKRLSDILMPDKGWTQYDTDIPRTDCVEFYYITVREKGNSKHGQVYEVYNSDNEGYVNLINLPYGSEKTVHFRMSDEAHDSFTDLLEQIKDMQSVS